METTAITEYSENAVETTATTTIPVELDVTAINNFVHVCTGLIFAVLAWTVGKYAYRFFKLFF